jgi:glycosyltransferase involved in cell wall biosynthesis
MILLNTSKPKNRILFIFTASESLIRMLAKGNIEYLRHYESSFDRTFVIYLQGNRIRPIHMGKIVMIGLGGRGRFIDVLLSPIYLFALARRIRTPHRLTADVLYGWWATSLAKVALQFKYTLMPVCMPRELWKIQAPLTTFIENGVRRAFSRLSFLAANRVLTAKGCGNYISWLTTYSPARSKLLVVTSFPDLLPTSQFFRSIDSARMQKEIQRDFDVTAIAFKLVYVGRLEPEKAAGDLITLMMRLCLDDACTKNVSLHLVGDGSIRREMQQRTITAGLSDRVIFHGTVANNELPAVLSNSHVFLSTLTGTSLREAALCRLPIVAYDLDWISGLLINEETALLVPRGDIDAMAAAVRRLLIDAPLRERLAANAEALAISLWSPATLNESLALAFPD